MNALFRALFRGLISVLVPCGMGSSAWAQSHGQLVDMGGPVLSQFTIYPLYYGDWSSPLDQAIMQAQQAYLTGLAGYLSGQGAPSGQRPTTWQYGVRKASVAPAVTASPNVTGPTKICDPPAGVPCAPSETMIRDIIHANQANNALPAYDANTLIMVFLPTGFTLSFPPSAPGCSYHGSESSSAFYAVVQTFGCGPLLAVTAHELFEAATDPVVGQGWYGSSDGEAVDVCVSGFNRPDIDKSIADIVAAYAAANPGQTLSLSPAVTGIADNTQPDPNKAGNVLCSTTGYYTPAPKPCVNIGSINFCYVVWSPLNPDIFFPDRIFYPIRILPQPCLACSYEVVVGGASMKNWTAEVVNAEGALVPYGLTRRDKEVILRLKPSAQDIRGGAIAEYRLRLKAGREIRPGVPYKIFAHIKVSIDSAPAKDR